jgi:transcriptional regulator of acetoin/glycerol metabolism
MNACSMKSGSEIVQLDSLAFLYAHQNELPYWLRGLTYSQLVDIAKLMTAWHSACGGQGIVPIEVVEQREIIRAVTVCGGDVTKAARELKISRRTVYKKLRRWGYPIENLRSIRQASALAQGPGGIRGQYSSL